MAGLDSDAAAFLADLLEEDSIGFAIVDFACRHG
jgi:hypothetical protein